jgi:hypothetical protein
LLTAIVSCAVAAAPEGVTAAGLNEHVAFAGSPEQAKLTAELNPFCGVTVMVVDPCAPESTVNDVGEAANVNAGASKIVYAADATGLSAKPLATAIASTVSVADTVIAPL